MTPPQVRVQHRPARLPSGEEMGRLVRGLAPLLLALVLISCGLGSNATTPPPGGSVGSDALSQGLAAHTAGRLDEAISLYFQALSKDPTNKFALFNLGQIEDTKNHLVAAEAWYRLALQSDNTMPSALYNLALVRQAVGDSIESASLLRSLINVDPNNALAHLAVVVFHPSLFGLVDPFPLFNVVLYLLLVLFPFTVLWSMRRMAFSFAQAALAAAASSLLATQFLYGLDYESYIWRGFGTYTQLWAMHLSFIGLAAAHTVITRGR